MVEVPRARLTGPAAASRRLGTSSYSRTPTDDAGGGGGGGGGATEAAEEDEELLLGCI